MRNAASIIADQILQWREDAAGLMVVGLCGAQGSGKTTAGTEAVTLLEAQGVRCAILALDDLVLPRAAREALAREVHPLLTTRGPPGTHEVGLGLKILAEMRAGQPVNLPVFNKLKDDRETVTRPVPGGMDVVLFEGWCVGALAQAPGDLIEPVNELERAEDPDCIWRTYVNQALGAPYHQLFGELDHLILLQAPGFEVVCDWRWQQEETTRARAGSTAAAGLDRAGVARFIQFYERITRHILKEMPDRAGLVIELGPDRQILAVAEGSGAAPL